MDSDGTSHVGSQDWGVYAVNPDGSQKWFYLTVPDKPATEAATVSVTEKGASVSGLPRGDYDTIVINAPRPNSGQVQHGAMVTDGYIYLFDIDVARQGLVTLDGALYAEGGSYCAVSTLEVWRD